MVETKDLEWLLDQFDIGASTAEKDPLLESAKIETQEFHDLYLYDRIDIVRGIKGSGKTALYRLFFFLKDLLIDKDNLYCVFGIEATGDPVFRQYKDDFENYNEIEFENFWGVYFISLVYKLIFNCEKITNSLTQEDIVSIDAMLKKIGLKLEKEGFSLKDIICSILDNFQKCRKIELGVTTKIDSSTPQVVSIKPSIEFEFANLKEVSKRPIYISEFKDLIVGILKKNNFRIWLMLDRLDEVFPHRSSIEKNGLRGILKTAYNFSDPSLRVKVFLRDDIIEYLASDGFTALTHVTDRCSSTMTWSKDSILHLIVKRIFANQNFVYYYNVDPTLADKDKNYREKIFYTIFPLRIGKTTTIDWLYLSCADSNKIVTPRDIIDFFRIAKACQFKKFKLNPEPQDFLISEDIFKISIGELSKHKRNSFLFAEFPHLKDSILAFEGRYAEHNDDSLQRILGREWHKIVDDLSSIGFIGRVPKSATYKIPFIWRKGLNIRRGRDF
jgi:hypothetical protein